MAGPLLSPVPERTSYFFRMLIQLMISDPVEILRLPAIRKIFIRGSSFAKLHKIQLTRLALGKQSKILSINFALPSGSSGKHTAEKQKNDLKTFLVS